MPDINLLLNLLKEFAWLGNWLFFTLAFIESAPFIGMFVPGATLISVGGFLASQDLLNTWEIIFFATIGAIVGDFFSYSLGRWGGDWIKDKKIINQTLLLHGERFFNKYGNKSVFWGRFFGPIRAIIPFVAGLSRMKRRPFIFWNILSAIGWAILNVFLGYFSGALVIKIFKRWSGSINIAIIIIIIIAIAYWIIKKKDQSFKYSFRSKSIIFVEKLNNYIWFKKLSNHYPFIPDYFKESRHAAEKFFGGFILFTLLILIYILTLVLDVF